MEEGDVAVPSLVPVAVVVVVSPPQAESRNIEISRTIHLV
jgi:hypothetical protein